MDDELRSRGGGGGPQVGGEVADGEVRLVSHRREGRDLRRGDGPGDDLFVEGPEVLDASPSPGKDDHLHVAAAVEGFDSLDQGLGGALPLNLGGVDQDTKTLVPTGQNAENVHHHGPLGGGDKADGAGKGREGALPLLGEETLLLKPLLKGFKPEEKVSETLGDHLFNDQLGVSPLLVEGDPSPDDDGVAVFGRKGDPIGLRAEHDATDLPLIVFQVEVEVA